MDARPQMDEGRMGHTRFDRASALDELEGGGFDVLVVGGGITGVGVALDAAARGLRACVVEREDFASGTSSKSSKMVHGGIRYLQQREFLLVYENLAERQRLLRNAPHLVTPLAFLIPLFGKGGVADSTVARAYSSALWTYDLTVGLRIGKRHRRIDAAEALSHFPTLRADRLVAAFLYYDAAADDARLTLAVARTAVESYGAVAANYAGVSGLAKSSSGRVVGATISAADPVTGQTRDLEVSAGVVVNAAGVWADEIRSFDNPGSSRTIRPAKGIHITLPHQKLPCDLAAVIPVPHDKRSIFVVPWGGEVYVGTTDTDYEGSIDDPRCTNEDVDYLLAAVNSVVTEAVSASDVIGAWAGLRPLLADTPGHHLKERTADLSRRHKVSVSPSGLVSIEGGKLTTYRKMAADTVDVVLARLEGRPVRPWSRRRHSPTKSLRLRGSEALEEMHQPGVAARAGTDADTLAHLVSRFGSDTKDVLALLESAPELGGPMVEGLPYLDAEVVYAIRYEMARCLEDVLARRTRALLHRMDATVAAAPRVAHLIASELGWTGEQIDLQVARFSEAAGSMKATAGITGPAR